MVIKTSIIHNEPLKMQLLDCGRDRSNSWVPGLVYFPFYFALNFVLNNGNALWDAWNNFTLGERHSCQKNILSHRHPQAYELGSSD